MNVRKVNETLSMITSKVKSKSSAINLANMNGNDKNSSSRKPKAMTMYQVTLVALVLIAINSMFSFNEPLFSSEVLQDIDDIMIMDQMDLMDDQLLDPHLRHLIETETDMDNVVRRLRELNEDRPLDHLRFLSLGYTNAKENGRKIEGASYTDLLSSNPDNVVRAAGELTGPLYAATCTQSLIQDAVGPRGDQEFDVIILNYYGRGLNGLVSLARRLRDRYPDALIIIFEVRYLHHIQWIRAGTQQVIGTLQQYAESRNVKYGTTDFFRKLRNPRFNFKWRGFEERHDVVTTLRTDLRPAIRVRSLNFDDNIIESLEKYYRFYSDDYNGLSVEGHLRLYRAVENAVLGYMATGQYRVNKRKGSWSPGDLCYSWYTSGSTRGVRYKRNGVVMEKFLSREGELYALSTISYFGWGWLEVQNRFGSTRSIILSYMASGPVSMYPKTEVYLTCDGQRRQRTVVHPTSDRDWHTVLTTKIGEVLNPGTCRVSWRAMERTDRPFRVTAVKILARSMDEAGVLGPKVDFDKTPY